MDRSFRLNPDVLREFPQTEILLITASGIRNDEIWAEVGQRIDELEAAVARGEWHALDEAHPAISSWHDAYRRFGTNPRRFRPSVDALGRRLGRDGRLPRINPAVDAYNLISVTYAIPAGALDVGGISGPVLIRFAQAGDSFVPLGEPETVQEPKPGEVVYAQGNNVLTRHWNHRDSDHTKVTERSRDVAFMLERVSAEAVPSSRLAEAQSALADLLRPHAKEVTFAVIEPR